jgi:hypothetical protein
VTIAIVARKNPDGGSDRRPGADARNGAEIAVRLRGRGIGVSRRSASRRILENPRPRASEAPEVFPTPPQPLRGNGASPVFRAPTGTSSSSGRIPPGRP